MKRASVINNLILAFVCFAGASRAQPLFSDYNSFLSSVVQTNPLSKRAENIGRIGQVQLKAAQGGFDPQLASGIESKQFNARHYFTSGIAELKQPLYTSQYLKVGYQYGQGAYLNPESNTPGAGLPYIGIEASLLQGLLFDKRRADVVKARHYSDYFTAEQKIQMNDLLFVASASYAEALYSKKINSLYGFFSDLAQQRLRGISELSAAGERPAIDTVEAAIFLQGRILDQQAGEIELIKKLNELSLVSAAPSDVSVSGQNLGDTLEQLYSASVAAIQRVLSVEQNTNPVITQYFARQKVLETEKRLRRELIKPVLDVSYNFLSVPHDAFFPGRFNNGYKWGATFSFPLFLRKPRNEYRLADLEAKNNDLEATNKQNQINLKRRFILESIQVTAAQIENAERSATYSKLLVEAEKLKFANGESSLFLLNSRESKWLETELKLAEYKLKYIKGFLELTYVNGDLRYEL